MHKHINTLESVLSLRLTYIGYLLLEQSQILNGNCGNNPDESNGASVGTFRMLVWEWIQGCKQDEQAAIATNSYTVCVHFLSTTPHLYLTFSPAGVRPCCISFAVLPQNTQRPTPLAHLGKSNNLRRVCVFAHFTSKIVHLKTRPFETWRCSVVFMSPRMPCNWIMLWHAFVCTACECELNYIWICGERERERIVWVCACLCEQTYGSHSLKDMERHKEGCVGDAGLVGYELILPLQKCPWQHSDDAIWAARTTIVTADYLTSGICWSHSCHLFSCLLRRQCLLYAFYFIYLFFSHMRGSALAMTRVSPLVMNEQISLVKLWKSDRAMFLCD